MEVSISTFAPICRVIRGKSIEEAEWSSPEGGRSAKKVNVIETRERGTSNRINQ